MDVYVFFHFQTAKRSVRKSAHPRFDAVIRKVKEEFFRRTRQAVTVADVAKGRARVGSVSRWVHARQLQTKQILLQIPTQHLGQLKPFVRNQ